MCKKNYFVIIITIIIFLCTFGCSQDPDDIEAEYVLSDMEMEEPNFSSETTHEAQLEETTKDSIPLDESELTNVINFDSEADLSLLGFYEQENIDCTIEDGMLIIAGRENQSGRVIVGLNEELYKHSVIHIKLMTYILPITSDFMPILQAKLQPQNLGLMCENLRPFDFLFYEGSWGMGVAYSYFDGTAELVNLGQWVDIILFLDEDGQTYRAILWESEDSSRIVCASIKLPQECVIDCFSLEFEVNTEALTYDAGLQDVRRRFRE